MKTSSQMLDSRSSPVVFTDGKTTSDRLAKSCSTHCYGLFVLAPSGTGKTYYVNGQHEKHWIDGDLLWTVTGSDYSDMKWISNIQEVSEIDARCDVITQQAKNEVFGSLAHQIYFWNQMQLSYHNGQYLCSIYNRESRMLIPWARLVQI